MKTPYTPIARKLGTLLIVLAWSSFCLGQSPGYQGKKLLVSYAVSSMPVSSNWLQQQTGVDINLRQALRLEYVLTRRWAVGLLYERTDDQLQLNNIAVTKQNPLALYLQTGSPFDPTSNTRFRLTANYRVNSFGFFLRSYRVDSYGSLAPLGAYWNLEGHFNNLQVSDDGRFYNNAQQKLHSFQSATILLGTGWNYILFKRLRVDFSVHAGVNFRGLSDYSAFRSYSNKAYVPNHLQIGSKLFIDNLLFCRLGFGYLIW